MCVCVKYCSFALKSTFSLFWCRCKSNYSSFVQISRLWLSVILSKMVFIKSSAYLCYPKFSIEMVNSEHFLIQKHIKMHLNLRYFMFAPNWSESYAYANLFITRCLEPQKAFSLYFNENYVSWAPVTLINMLYSYMQYSVGIISNWEMEADSCSYTISDELIKWRQIN
jgi:hypothetical protein